MFRHYDDKWTTPCKHHLPGIWWALDKCKQLLLFSSFKPILCFLYGSQPDQWVKVWDLRRMEEALTSSLSWEGKTPPLGARARGAEPRQALAFMIHERWKKKKKRARAPVAYTWLLLITLAHFLLRVSLAPRKRCFNSGERLFCVTLVDPCLVPDGSIFYYPHLTNGGVGGNLPKVTGPSDFNDNFLLSEYGLLS